MPCSFSSSRALRRLRVSGAARCTRFALLHTRLVAVLSGSPSTSTRCNTRSASARVREKGTVEPFGRLGPLARSCRVPSSGGGASGSLSGSRGGCASGFVLAHSSTCRSHTRANGAPAWTNALRVAPSSSHANASPMALTRAPVQPVRGCRKTSRGTAIAVASSLFAVRLRRANTGAATVCPRLGRSSDGRISSVTNFAMSTTSDGTLFALRCLSLLASAALPCSSLTTTASAPSACRIDRAITLPP